MIFYIKSFPVRTIYCSNKDIEHQHRQWPNGIRIAAESDIIFTVKDGKLDKILKNRYFHKPHYTEEDLVVLRLNAIPL